MKGSPERSLKTMEYVTLPQYFKLGDTTPVQLVDYHNSSPVMRGQVNLTQNTFSFLRDGTKEVFTSHDPISIQNSKFLVIKSGHCLMTEKLSASNQTYRSVLLFFSDEALFEFAQKQNVLSKSGRAAKAVQVCPYDEFIHSFVKSLVKLQSLEASLRDKLLRVKFEEIMLYLTETQGPDFLHHLLANADNQARTLINVVESNALNRLTLKQLAFLCNMSVSTFKREFEKHFHEPPIRWFQNQRLEHAAFLLKTRAKRPSEVFEEVGYESLSTFTQAFKSRYGATPGQYQKSD